MPGVASTALALLAENGKSRDELAVALETLRASRPTAVNLMNNLDRMKRALWQEEYVPALVSEALRLIDECSSLRQVRHTTTLNHKLDIRHEGCILASQLVSSSRRHSGYL